jgi:hypothetical protein
MYAYVTFVQCFAAKHHHHQTAGVFLRPWGNSPLGYTITNVGMTCGSRSSGGCVDTAIRHLALQQLSRADSTPGCGWHVVGVWVCGCVGVRLGVAPLVEPGGCCCALWKRGCMAHLLLQWASDELLSEHSLAQQTSVATEGYPISVAVYGMDWTSHGIAQCYA